MNWIAYASLVIVGAIGLAAAFWIRNNARKQYERQQMAEFQRDFLQAWKQAEIDDNMPESSRTEFVSDHVRLDQRSLALHRAIAEKIRANPALLEKALQNINRWKVQSPSLSGSLNEWEAIINQGIDKTIEFMCDPGEEATRLRQSSPFVGILTEVERLVIFDAFSRDRWGKS